MFKNEYLNELMARVEKRNPNEPEFHQTVREVLEIGDDLGLPSHLVHKEPSDGMCGKSDEDNLGFTYKELDDWIRGTGKVSEETLAKIEKLHLASRHKYEPMPTYTDTEFIPWRPFPKKSD